MDERNVFFGTELDEKDILQLFELDKLVYEAQYVGAADNMLARFRAEKNSFVAIKDEKTGQFIGYINYLNMSAALYQDIIYDTQVIRDDDIRPEELAEFSADRPNHLFILSMVIHPAYRNQKTVIKTLTDGFIKAILKLEQAGFPVGSISGAAVSEGGCKMLRGMWFRQSRRMDDGNILYICDGGRLERLKQNRLYFKTFRDDIYLFLPYADHVLNTRVEDYLRTYDPDQVTGIEKVFLEELQENLEYECKSGVSEGITLMYIGKYPFLHTTDEYDTIEDREIVIGTEEVYLFLASHLKSHMHILIMMMPDSRYSTSQTEDQLSAGYIKIKTGTEKGYDVFENINAYLKRKFGLHACGSGKSILCMSGKPETEQEFRNIMAAEAYNSIHVNYFIDNDKIREICGNNKAKYDYYEVYMSDMVVALILKDYDLKLENRISIMATYLFIAVLVMFQNASLDKMHIKISRALSDDGQVSYAYIDELYKNFGMTVQFWEKQNFKYTGTQMEAEAIEEAFANRQIKETYMEEQGYLEHIVELKMAQNERINGWVINIAAIILALLQVEPYIVTALTFCYEKLGIDVLYVNRTFNTGVFGGLALILVIYAILRRKRRKS
ncbi:MAG TPA: hypothetical protein IAA08_06225 [Candidatus Eubacterium avistercoris]|uniref:Uncharacterized protein n=1 Tax=Candidatus Eubacterium avistercoris TaxID=2838567 RepID=A0A9D2D309_9FIRM|nr:hypothetical protein [Candidatus Eubacterium avistercoris]